MAELDTAGYDDLTARQVRLAEAMCEIFFRQLKLINAAMIELPLGWLRAETEQTCEQAVLPPVPPAAVDIAMLAEALATQIADTEILPATRKPKKASLSRKKTATKPKC
ncbi:MAG: hypothetical protein WCF20_08950 [Methylovirgula sp.]